MINRQFVSNTPVTKDRIQIYETLRDGLQRIGLDASFEEKKALFDLTNGIVDFNEVGYPGANVIDDALMGGPDLHLQGYPKTKTRVMAFGMTMRYDHGTPDKDPGVQALFNSSANGVCFVGKSSVASARSLGITEQQNLEVLEKTVSAGVATGKLIMVDMEHFFDGYKKDPDYSLAVLRTLHSAGASWMIMCDTNGGTRPEDIAQITREVIAEGFSGSMLGIHAHDDMGMAVANSIAAVDAGVRMVQGTFMGIGERCGNANLTTIIGNFHKLGYNCGITPEQMAKWTELNSKMEQVLDLDHDPYRPYVGANAFGTKAGIHASTLAKDPMSYTHTEPEAYGNHLKIIGGSTQSGKANLKAKVEEMGLPFDPKDKKWEELIKSIKALEDQGYAFDQADGSLEVLILDAVGALPRYFEIDRIQQGSEMVATHKLDQYDIVSHATVKMHLPASDEPPVIAHAEGSGTFNAVDKAMRELLVPLYPDLADMHLHNYRVRITSSDDETAARTRVGLTSRNGVEAHHQHWTTQGVSHDVLSASNLAQMASIRWYLHSKGVAEKNEYPQLSRGPYGHIARRDGQANRVR